MSLSRFHFFDLMMCVPVVPLFFRPLIQVLLIPGAALVVLTTGFAVDFLIFDSPYDVALGRAMGHVQWIKLVCDHVRLQKYLYITRIIGKMK